MLVLYISNWWRTCKHKCRCGILIQGIPKGKGNTSCPLLFYVTHWDKPNSYFISCPLRICAVALQEPRQPRQMKSLGIRSRITASMLHLGLVERKGAHLCLERWEHEKKWRQKLILWDLFAQLIYKDIILFLLAAARMEIARHWNTIQSRTGFQWLGRQCYP